MLEWFQEQQKTVHCYNAKDKKGRSACRADFPSQRSEHFRLRFPCPDDSVTGEGELCPRTPFSEKPHGSLVDHWLLPRSSDVAHTNSIWKEQEWHVDSPSFHLSLVSSFKLFHHLNTVFAVSLILNPCKTASLWRWGNRLRILSLKKLRLASDRSGACSQVCWAPKPMTFPMAELRVIWKDEKCTPYCSVGK